jgi:hypothetical protein
MNSLSSFFIVGFQRSGTTLLRVMLDAHPDIAIPLDTVGLWDRYERMLPAYGSLSSGDGRRRIIQDLLKEERILLWKEPFTEEEISERWPDLTYPGLIQAFYRAYADRRGKRIWGDKDPGNMVRIDQLNRWFPDSLIIHIIRDGRDACLSQMKQDFGFENLLECAAGWREEVQWVRRMGQLLGPARYREILYEALISDPAAELQELCGFLGITYDPAMLAYHQSVDRAVPEEKRHVWPLIAAPPVKDNAGRWKEQMTASQRICFEKRAGKVLGELGYEVLPNPSGGYLEEIRSIGTRTMRSLKRRLHRS